MADRLTEIAEKYGLTEDRRRMMTMTTNDPEGVRIVVYTDDKPFRKRACLNCGRRGLWGAGSRCGYDGHYIGYCSTWDDWCRHWTKDKRKPGEIEVYDEAD